MVVAVGTIVTDTAKFDSVAFVAGLDVIAAVVSDVVAHIMILTFLASPRTKMIAFTGRKGLLLLFGFVKNCGIVCCCFCC